MKKPDLIYSLSITLENNIYPILEELLACIDLFPVIWNEVDKNFVIFNFYHELENQAEEQKINVVNLILNSSDLIKLSQVKIEIKKIEKEDWSESWKKFFHPQKVSERIVIKPTWEEYKPLDNELVLEIDPGMAFGTGQHGTSVACIRFLESITEKSEIVSMLDVGTGSGILSIAADKLGLKEIDAFDYDSNSVKTAIENYSLNNPNTKAHFFEANLNTWQASKKYDIVVANILFCVLIENIETLKASVKAQSYLILSGILTIQYPQVKDKLISLGFSQLDTITLKEWTSGLFQNIGVKPPFCYFHENKL